MSQSKNLIEQTRRLVEQQMIRENAPSPTLQNLHTNLKHSIIGMLNYKNATSLASTSKQWGRNVQTQLATRKPVKFYYVKYSKFGLRYSHNNSPGEVDIETDTYVLLYDDPRSFILQELGARKGIEIPDDYLTRYSHMINTSDDQLHIVSKLLMNSLHGYDKFMSTSTFEKKFKYTPIFCIGTFYIQEVPEFDCYGKWAGIKKSNGYGNVILYKNKHEFAEDWDVYDHKKYFRMLKRLSPKSIQTLIRLYKDTHTNNNNNIHYNNNTWRKYTWKNVKDNNTNTENSEAPESNHNGSNSRSNRTRSGSNSNNN